MAAIQAKKFRIVVMVYKYPAPLHMLIYNLLHQAKNHAIGIHMARIEVRLYLRVYQKKAILVYRNITHCSVPQINVIGDWTANTLN